MLGQGFVQAFLPGSGRQSSRIHRDEPVRNRSPRQLTGCTSPGHSKARRSRWPQAKPQPPSRVTRPAAERCCAAPALPAGGERRGAGGGRKESGRPVFAARRGPRRTAAGPSAPSKPARIASRSRYRPSYTFLKPRSRPLVSCGRRPCREPRHPSPRLLCGEDPPQPQCRRPAGKRLAAGSPASSGRSSGELLSPGGRQRSAAQRSSTQGIPSRRPGPRQGAGCWATRGPSSAAGLGHEVMAAGAEGSAATTEPAASEVAGAAAPWVSAPPPEKAAGSGPAVRVKARGGSPRRRRASGSRPTCAAARREGFAALPRTPFESEEEGT